MAGNAVIGSLRADLSARTGEYEANMDKAAAKTAGFGANFKRMAAEVDRSSARVDRSTNAMVGSYRNAERQITNASAGIKNALMGTASALAVGFSVEGVRRAADTWTMYTNSLRVAGLEGQKLVGTQEQLYQLAQKYGVSVAGLGDLYGKAAQTADTLGASEQQLGQFVTTTAAALKIQGKGSAAASGALLQLTQLLGGTKVQAQEYNSLIDGMYPLLQAVAAGSDRWGGSVAALTRDVKDSNVTVQEFFQAALAGSAMLEKKATQAAFTTSSSIEIIANAWAKYIGQTDAALGASERFNLASRGIAENLDEIVPALAVLAVAFAGKYVGSLKVGERSLGTFAVAQAKMVAEVVNGSRAINAEAESNRLAANAAVVAAVAKQDLARATREEAAANLASLNTSVALIRAEREAAELALRDATTKRQRTVATRALAAARRDEAAMTKLQSVAQRELATAWQAESVAQGRATQAHMAYTVAARASGAAATVAAGASRLLSGALAFFGGPIGLAITAVGAALVYLASSAQKAAQASENAQATLDDLKSKAEAADAQTRQLSKDTDDLADSTSKSAEQSRDAADAYDAQAVSAANAAKAIRTMNAAQREALYLRLQTDAKDLKAAISGGNIFTTNAQERADNARRDVLKSFGIRTLSGGFQGQTEDMMRRARADVAAGRATPAQVRAMQEYDNALALLTTKTRQLAETEAAAEVVFKGIDDPVEPPATTPPVTGGGGGGGKTDKEKAAEARDDNAFSVAMRREKDALLAAQAEITGTAKERLDIEIQRVTAEAEARKEEIAREGPGGTGKFDAAQVAALQAAVEATAEQKRVNLRLADTERRQAEILAAKTAERETQIELLRGQSGLAKTSRERRDLELKILRLQYEEERARLEGIIASKTTTEAEKKIAQLRLDKLAELQAAGEAQVIAGTKSPMEEYRDSVDKTAGEIIEDLERVGTEGLDGITDGITDAIMGTKDLGEAFHEVALSIIRDLVRIGVQQMVTKPLADWLFGGSGGFGGGGGGGGGGFFQSAVSAISSFFGGFRANGGDVMSGRGYVVGERGPELFMPGSDGAIIPNHALGASPSGGVTVNVYAQDAVLTGWVRKEVAAGVATAVGMSVPAAVEAATALVPAEMQRDGRNQMF